MNLRNLHNEAKLEHDLPEGNTAHEIAVHFDMVKEVGAHSINGHVTNSRQEDNYIIGDCEYQGTRYLAVLEGFGDSKYWEIIQRIGSMPANIDWKSEKVQERFQALLAMKKTELMNINDAIAKEHHVNGCVAGSSKTDLAAFIIGAEARLAQGYKVAR